MVHRVEKSQTQLKQINTHINVPQNIVLQSVNRSHENKTLISKLKQT